MATYELAGMVNNHVLNKIEILQISLNKLRAQVIQIEKELIKLNTEQQIDSELQSPRKHTPVIDLTISSPVAKKSKKCEIIDN
jgi:hypothetical protein